MTDIETHIRLRHDLLRLAFEIEATKLTPFRNTEIHYPQSERTDFVPVDDVIESAKKLEQFIDGDYKRETAKPEEIDDVDDDETVVGTDAETIAEILKRIKRQGNMPVKRETATEVLGRIKQQKSGADMFHDFCDRLADAVPAVEQRPSSVWQNSLGVQTTRDGFYICRLATGTLSVQEVRDRKWFRNPWAGQTNRFDFYQHRFNSFEKANDYLNAHSNEIIASY